MADIDHSALVATLDLKSKVALLTGASMFTLAPEASIGLTEIRLADGPTGVRGLKFSEPDQPVRLVGWESTQVRTGASVTLDVRTDERMWRRWDTATNTWSPLAAGGQLLLARCLGDVRATIGLSPTDG